MNNTNPQMMVEKQVGIDLGVIGIWFHVKDVIVSPEQMDNALDKWRSWNNSIFKRLVVRKYNRLLDGTRKNRSQE